MPNSDGSGAPRCLAVSADVGDLLGERAGPAVSGGKIRGRLVLRLPLKSGVLSFVQNVDKELRNGGKASTCGIHAGI